jgi:hypothetical protein
MSLARAFTTRRARQPLDLKESGSSSVMPQRSNTVSKASGYNGSIRNKISAPMALTHTTNMLAYNAPDLFPKSASSTTSSKASDDESEGNLTSVSSPPTSPDVPSIEDRSHSPEPNHLSCYFTAPGQKLPATSTSPVPEIPKRAPSHTKKTYDNLAARQHKQQQRQLSQSSANSIASKSSSSSMSRSSSTSTPATSIRSVPSNTQLRSKASVPAMPPASVEPVMPAHLSHRSEVPANHPFGKELAQVSELAEDYGGKDRLHIVDEEEQELIRKGLTRLRAEDYLVEVHELFATFFVTEPTAQAQPVWI